MGKNSGCVENTSDKDMLAANDDLGKVGEENSRVQSNTGTNGYDKDMAMKRKLSGESEPEEKAKKIRSEEPSSEDKELKKRKRSEDDNDSEEKKQKLAKTESVTKIDDIKENNEKEASLRQSTEEIQKPYKPILSMTMEEIREEFKLTKIKSYVKIKNCKILAKAIREQEKARDKLWEEKKENEALERKAELEAQLKKQNAANGKDVSGIRDANSISNTPVGSRSNSPSKLGSPSSKNIKSRSPSLDARSKSSSASRSGSPNTKYRTNKSRSNSGIPKSRSPSRSVDRPKSKPTSIINSRSPSRSRSNSKARSTSKSVPPRSPSVDRAKSKPTSVVNSRSPTRSRSNSRGRSRSPSKSVPPRSGSPSI